MPHAPDPTPDPPESIDRPMPGVLAPSPTAAGGDDPGAPPGLVGDHGTPQPVAAPSSRPSVHAAVAVRPTATLRAATAPSRAEMAGRSTVLSVTPWEDGLLDQFGHDPRSPYVERFWLGVLGPSATWLLRSFAHRFDTEPEGFSIDLKDTAKALGIGARGGANGALYRTMERVMAFGFAQYTDHDVLAVRRRMAPLTRRQQQRLPHDLQLEHDTWLAAHPATTTPSVDDIRRRARALALSLLELGEDVEATEQQLHRWRFHPAVAFDSVRWAATVHQHRRATGAADLDATQTPAGGDAA